jgi:hypothetical protein
MGATIVEWGRIDWAIGNMLTITMAPQPEATSRNSDWIAQAVMRELDTLHLRTRVVRSVLIALLPDFLKEQWEKIEDQLRKRAKERNLLAHGKWGICDEFPEDMIYLDPAGPRIRYTAKDFAATLRRMYPLTGLLDDFTDKVLEANRTTKRPFLPTR